MAERPLTPDEAALWARVLASVTPLRRPVAISATVAPPQPLPEPAAMAAPAPRMRGRVPPPRAVAPRPAPSTTPHHAATLDAGWDRRLSRGLVAPDVTVDLHGETLASAYVRLDGALDAAIAQGARVVLLITGRPPRPESERPHARGAIRAAVADWLAGSRHADRIAAVRAASPRHGGSGALYLVLRRPRARKS